MQHNKMEENMRRSNVLGKQSKILLNFSLRSCFGFYFSVFIFYLNFFFVREKKGGHASLHTKQFTFTRCGSICLFFIIFCECAGFFSLDDV